MRGHYTQPPCDRIDDRGVCVYSGRERADTTTVPSPTPPEDEAPPPDPFAGVLLAVSLFCAVLLAGLTSELIDP